MSPAAPAASQTIATRRACMRKILVGSAATLLLVAASACTMTEQSLRSKGLVPQTQKELEQRFSQPVKVRFTNNAGVSGIASFTPDGTVRVEWPGNSDTGTWRVKEGKLCTKYTKIR